MCNFFNERKYNYLLNKKTYTAENVSEIQDYFKIVSATVLIRVLVAANILN